jgi:hypothetical protein
MVLMPLFLRISRTVNKFVEGCNEMRHLTILRHIVHVEDGKKVPISST